MAVPTAEACAYNTHCSTAWQLQFSNSYIVLLRAVLWLL